MGNCDNIFEKIQEHHQSSRFELHERKLKKNNIIQKTKKSPKSTANKMNKGFFDYLDEDQDIYAGFSSN